MRSVSNTDTESRTKKTLLNARVNLIFYFLTLVLSFFSRKIFLDCLGAEFIGLTGTLYNLLGFLNLAELGIGIAIGYVLYKPLYDRDEKKICEIISVMGYLYRWIGIIILIIGCIIACFLPFIFPDTGFPLSLIYFAYFSFLTSSLIGYFINYRQNLLSADQRNYVVTSYFQSANILKIIVQLSILYYNRNLYLWIIIEFIFGIIHALILNLKINQTYPWLKTNISSGRKLLKQYPEIGRYIKQLFIQKISYAVQYQTVPILIYYFVDLSTVAFYGNYTIITDKLSQLVNTFFDSSSAGVGNLIAEGNKTKIKKLFWELLSFRYFVGGVISFSVYVLIDPFISLWLGEEYLLRNIVVFLISVNIFISYTRGGVMQFLFGYGLFRDVWAPVMEVIVNLTVAISAGSLWGLPGVMLGGIVGQILIVCIWKPCFLFRAAFEEPIWNYWKYIIVYFFNILAPVFAIIYIINPYLPIEPSRSMLNWILFALIEVCIYVILSMSLFLLLTQGFRDLMKRLPFLRRD